MRKTNKLVATAVTEQIKQVIELYKKEFDSEWMSAFKATVNIAVDCAKRPPRSYR